MLHTRRSLLFQSMVQLDGLVSCSAQLAMATHVVAAWLCVLLGPDTNATPDAVSLAPESLLDADSYSSYRLGSSTSQPTLLEAIAKVAVVQTLRTFSSQQQQQQQQRAAATRIAPWQCIALRAIHATIERHQPSMVKPEPGGVDAMAVSSTSSSSSPSSPLTVLVRSMCALVLSQLAFGAVDAAQSLHSCERESGRKASGSDSGGLALRIRGILGDAVSRSTVSSDVASARSRHRIAEASDLIRIAPWFEHWLRDRFPAVLSHQDQRADDERKCASINDTATMLGEPRSVALDLLLALSNANATLSGALQQLAITVGTWLIDTTGISRPSALVALMQVTAQLLLAGLPLLSSQSPVYKKLEQPPSNATLQDLSVPAHLLAQFVEHLDVELSSNEPCHLHVALALIQSSLLPHPSLLIAAVQAAVALPSSVSRYGGAFQCLVYRFLQV